MNKYIKKLFSFSFTLFLILAIFASCSNNSTKTTANNSTSTEAIDNATLKHNLTLVVTSDIHAGVEDNFTLAGVYEKKKE